MGVCKNTSKKAPPFNLHIFVNSVDFIAKVIRHAKLTPEHVRVVCSKSGDSQKKNQRKLGSDFTIALPHDPIKKINFYTSTCFEGCDIYDPLGKTYIVSDGSKNHTLVDISTQFTQIAGRLRNSTYNSAIIHIYSKTRYSGLSFEEFKESAEKTLSESEKFVTDINNIPEDSRKKVLSNLSFTHDK